MQIKRQAFILGLVFLVASPLLAEAWKSKKYTTPRDWN